MALKNVIIKSFIRLIQPLLAKHPPRKRILIIATTALGDTLWATPALESLKASFPNAYLAVLTSPIGLEIFKHNPWVDQLYLLKEPLLPRFFSLWKTLYKEKFDTILFFHASQRLALPLCALLGASQIVGTIGHQKGLDSLLTDPLPNDYQHEIVRRLKIIEHIGGSITSQTLSLFLQPEELSSLPPGTWVALHPGSKDSFKRWPVEHFAMVGRKLQEKFGCNILLTGTEKELLKELQDQIPGALLKENLPLRAFAALLQNVDLLISNDTGPVHVACALNRAVIALYASTDPAICGPHLAKNAIAIAKRPTCTPCLKRKCRRPFCFLQISPEEVFKASLCLLSSETKRQNASIRNEISER